MSARSPSNCASTVDLGAGVFLEVEVRYDDQYWDDANDLKTAPPQLSLRVLSPVHETMVGLDAEQAQFIAECLRRAALLLNGEEVPA
jgi:hypothetical protein